MGGLRDRLVGTIKLPQRVALREASLDVLDLGLLIPACFYDGLEAELFQGGDHSYRRDRPAVRDASQQFVREAAGIGRLRLRLLLRGRALGQEAEEDLGERAQGVVYHRSPDVVPT